MASGPVTIIELAAALGLSKTTVADALAGSGRVSESTRKRVQVAANEMGYVSNRAARQLRTKTAEGFALYIPPHVRNMSFYMPFAFGAADQAALYGYDLTLIAQKAENAGSWSHVDGAIIIDALAVDPVVTSLLDRNLPIVTAGDIAGLPHHRVAGVVEIDHARTCTLVLEELKRQGAARPAFIAPTPGPDGSWSQQVRDGYVAWCESEAVPANIVTIPTIPTDEELEEALHTVISVAETDALVFGWHDVANRGELQLERLGHRERESIPIGVLASSKENLHGTNLTIADLHPREFGAAAVELLHDILRDPTSPNTRRSHEPEIISARNQQREPGR